MSEKTAGAQIAAQAAANAALFKVLLVAIALAVVPISTYFAISLYLWKGQPEVAALGAIGTALAVLAGYIVMAVNEDRGDVQEAQRAREQLEQRKTK